MGVFLTLRGGGEVQRVACAFAEHGLRVRTLPLQEITRLPVDMPDGAFAAVLATSAHAAPWLAEQATLRTLPALAVGERTANALRAVGFGDVRVGSGEAVSLVSPAREIVMTRGGAILYAAGRVRRPETETLLAAAGLRVRTVEVYDTHLRTPKPGEIEDLLREGMPGGVLLLSVAQARCMADLAAHLPGVRLFCLSLRIRAALPSNLQLLAEVVPVPTLAALAELAAGGQEARRMP